MTPEQEKKGRMTEKQFRKSNKPEGPVDKKTAVATIERFEKRASPLKWSLMGSVDSV